MCEDQNVVSRATGARSQALIVLCNGTYRDERGHCSSFCLNHSISIHRCIKYTEKLEAKSSFDTKVLVVNFNDLLVAPI